MIGYALLNEQVNFMNIVEGKKESILKSAFVKSHLKQDKIGKYVIDFFKTVDPDNTDGRSPMASSFYLTGIGLPNKIWFLTVDHREDYGFTKGKLR